MTDWTYSDIPKILVVLAVLVGAWILGRILRFVVGRIARTLISGSTRKKISQVRDAAGLDFLESQKSSQRQSQRADTLSEVARSLTTFTVWVLALFVILAVLDVDASAIFAGAGFLGLGLGFGAQQLISDFTSGFFMLAEDQYGVGDFIDLGEAKGTVEQVSLRTTSLRDVDGTLWFVPNGEVRRVGNMSQHWSRAVIDVDVAYDTDVAKARSVILDTAKSLAEEDQWADKVLSEPEVWGVENLGPDAISVRLVLKTRPLQQFVVARELRERIKTALSEAGIEIPFPQRTVWIKSDGGSDDLRSE